LNPDTKFWVALSTHQKIGARTFGKLFKRFGKLEKIWRSNNQQLAEAGLDLSQMEAVKEVIAQRNPDKEIDRLKKYDIKVIILADKDYPKMLQEIPDPPGLLYVRGKILPKDEIALAVVGSRKFSPYGKKVTDELVWSLAKTKITIISGLALGIDAFAHQAALEAGGRTIAVLACGLDQIYPINNIRLADKILASEGAIISEFPLGMPALNYNFPIRNRIIAGLSLGTVVIEAAENSGSLLTAAAAIDYNREVFAVPGEIFSETSYGTNKLIRMGAKLITSYQDILDELQITQKEKISQAREIVPDTADEEILLKLLKEPQIIDEIVRKSKMTPAQVNSVLIGLEIKGKINNLGGTRYVINGKLRQKPERV